MEMFYQKLMEFGLSGCIFAGFIVVLNWVFKVNSKVLEDMSKERLISMEINKGFVEQLNMNREANRAFHLTVAEAHKFQREEHKEMIDILKTINNRVN